MAGQRELKTYHAALAEAAIVQFGRRCPCCGNAMMHGKPRRKTAAAHNRGDRATVAHYAAKSLNGNSTVWVWACRKCNLEQGALSMRQWVNVLSHVGDERAARVRLLADFIETWCAARGVPLVWRRRDAA